MAADDEHNASSDGGLSEGEKKGEEKRKREEGGEEGEKGKESKKSRIIRKTPPRDRGYGNGDGSLEALIRGFREETCRTLEDLNR